MKNTKENFSILRIFIFCYFAVAGIPVTLSAQLALVPQVAGCKVDITSTLDAAVGSIPDADETSAGLFYRIDEINPLGLTIGSYFWKDTIYKPNAGITKSLVLPVGDYKVVGYVSRKGGPIKTGYAAFEIDNSTCASPPSGMPSVFPIDANPSASRAFRLRLDASWNICTDPNYFIPVNEHKTETINTSTLATPWFFVTLSLSNWGEADASTVEVKFDGNILQYEGAIADNFHNNTSGSWGYVDQIDGLSDANKVFVTIKGEPKNKETHLHLMFKKKNNSLDAVVKTDFTATVTSASGTDFKASTALFVKAAPHDPNSLEVNKDTICPCQTNQWLQYRVNFQNIGKAPASHVKVTLSNDISLLPETADVLYNNSFSKKTFVHETPVVYDSLTKTFNIDSINLPGTNQPGVDASQTCDFFDFKIKVDNCRKLGTIIKPMVKIVFISGIPQPPIFTNLESTVVANIITEEKECPQPAAACTSCKKKKCWLLQLFSKKKTKK